MSKFYIDLESLDTLTLVYNIFGASRAHAHIGGIVSLTTLILCVLCGVCILYDGRIHIFVMRLYG